MVLGTLIQGERLKRDHGEDWKENTILEGRARRRGGLRDTIYENCPAACDLRKERRHSKTLRSERCHPPILVNGKVAGRWRISKGFQVRTGKSKTLAGKLVPTRWGNRGP